jgi:Flp pilus assembly protein TadD
MKLGVAGALAIAAGALVTAGCAGLRQPHGPLDRFMLHRDQKYTKDAGQPSSSPPPPTLEETIGKTRRLMVEAKPEPKVATPLLESQDRELMAALAAAAAEPTARHLVDVAAIYHQHGLLERAYDYHRRALRVDSRDAGAHEGLARVWRDWGLPQLAIADAQRAVFYAPASASARNTLGTILQALGQRDAARRAYRVALALDPQAAYAFNNLCYLSFLGGRQQQAIEECQTAVRLDPSLTAARNNLALAYAATGRPDLARREFAAAGGPAATAYNMGIVYASQAQFADAAHEFEMAYAMSPPFFEAARRAIAARKRATEQVQERGQ